MGVINATQITQGFSRIPQGEAGRGGHQLLTLV